MNEETREALDAQSVDMDRIKEDIRGLQEDVRLVLRKLNDMADNSSDSTVEIKQERSQFPEAQLVQYNRSMHSVLSIERRRTWRNMKLMENAIVVMV